MFIISTIDLTELPISGSIGVSWLQMVSAIVEFNDLSVEPDIPLQASSASGFFLSTYFSGHPSTRNPLDSVVLP